MFAVHARLENCNSYYRHNPLSSPAMTTQVDTDGSGVIEKAELKRAHEVSSWALSRQFFSLLVGPRRNNVASMASNGVEGNFN